MSTSNTQPRTGRYDQYIPLFGRANDMRVRLFLDTIFDSSEQNRKNLSISGNMTALAPSVPVPEQLKNKYYEPRPSVGNDDDINPEWSQFMCDIEFRARNPITINFTSVNPTAPQIEHNDRIMIVRGLAGTHTDPLKNFMQLVVKQFMVLFVVAVGAAPENVSNNVSRWNEVNRISVTMSNTYANLFTNITGAARPAAPAACATADSGLTEFKFKISKYFVQRFLEDAYNSSVTPVSSVSSFFNDPASPSAMVFMRNAAGELVDASGKVVTMSDLKVTDKCLTSNFQDGNPLPDAAGVVVRKECNDYLRDCLVGNTGSVEKCKEFLQSPNFWDDSQKEVDAMNPGIMLKTLEAFGFQSNHVFDSNAKRQLLTCESVNDWLSSLKKLTTNTPPKLTVAEYDNIAKNTKLVGYLGMIVAKVNANPSILNKDFSGSNMVTNNNQLFRGTKLSNMGMKPIVPKTQASAFNGLGNLIAQNQASRVSVSLRMPGFSGSTPFRFVGGAPQFSLQDLQARAQSPGVNLTASLLKNNYYSFISRLANLNKTISDADKKKVEELLNDLEKTEHKLSRAAVYAEKYARLLEMYGETDNTNVLSYDHLKDFVDKRDQYFQKTATKQNNLVSIIQTIANTLANNQQANAQAAQPATGVRAPIRSGL